MARIPVGLLVAPVLFWFVKERGNSIVPSHLADVTSMLRWFPSCSGEDSDTRVPGTVLLILDNTSDYRCSRNALNVTNC
jgi:hypothetical protein